MTRIALLLLTLMGLAAAPLRAEHLPGPDPSVVVFSKDGGTVVIGWTDGVVTAGATARNTPPRELWRAPDQSAIESLAFSADGKRLLVASDHTLQVSDWPSGRVVRRHDMREDSYEEAQISPDGLLVAMPLASADETLVLNLATGTVRRLIGGDRGGQGLDAKGNPAFSGDLVLTYGDDPDQPMAETIFVWSRAGTLRFKAEICCGNRIAELVPGRRLLLGGPKNKTSTLDLVTGVETVLPGKWPNDKLLTISGGVVAAEDDRFVVHEVSGAARGGLRYPKEGKGSNLARVGSSGLALWESGPGVLTVMQDIESDAITGRLALFRDEEPLAVSPDGAWIAIRPGTRVLHLRALPGLSGPPMCLSRPGDAGACQFASALELFHASGEAERYDGARQVIAALRARHVTMLEEREFWSYVEAAERLTAAGAATEARAAFAWLASSPEATHRQTATLGIARVAAGEGDAAQAERLLLALLPQVNAKVGARECLYCEVQAELALASLALGKTDAAVKAAADAERISNEGYTALHRARYAAVRARTLLAAGRREEALAAADRAVSIARGYVGGDSVQLQAHSLIEQAELLFGAEQRLQGLAIASEAADTAANASPPAGALVLEMRQRLGELRLRAGDAPAALVPLRAGAAAIAGADALASAKLTERWRGLFRLQVAAAWSAAHPSATVTRTTAAAARDLAAPSLSKSRRPPIGPLPVRHSGSVDSIAFSTDDRILATGDSDGGRLALWDSRTGATMGSFVDPERKWLRRIVFTADGAGVAAVTHDRRLLAWRIADGQPIEQPRFVRPFYAQVDGGILRVDASGATKRFALGLVREMIDRGDGTAAAFVSTPGVGLCILDASPTPRCAVRKAEDQFSRFNFVGFGLDGRLIAVTRYKAAICVVDPERLEVVQRIPLARESISAGVAVLAPDGRTIAVRMEEHALRLIDATTGTPGLEVSTGAGEIERLAFSNDGRRIVAGLRNGTAVVYEVATGRRVFGLGAAAGPAHNGAIRAVALSADGRLAATGGDDYTVRLWNTDDGSQNRAVALDGTALTFLDATTLFAPGEPATLDVVAGVVAKGIKGERVAQRAAVSLAGVSAVAWSEGRIETFGPDGRPLATMRDGFDTSPGEIALSPDGRRVVADRFDQVMLWNAATGATVAEIPMRGRELPGDLEDIPDEIALTNRQLYVRNGAVLHIFDAVTGAVLSGGDAPACSGGRIAAGGDAVVFGYGPVLCLARDGQSAITEIKVRDAGRLSALAVSPAGKLAALGFKDGAIVLVDLATRMVTTMDVAQQGPVTALAFARDVPFLLTGSLDRTALLIDLVSRRAIALLGR